MRKTGWKRRILSLLCAGVLLTGCGAESAAQEGKNIELVAPSTVAVNSEVAQVRTIRDAKTYAAFVVPQVEEYGFAGSANVNGAEYYPGDEVKAGDVLVNSDNTSALGSLQKKVDEFEEYQKNHETYLISQQEILDELERKMNTSGISSTEYQILSYKAEAICNEMEEKNRLYELDCEYGKAYLEQQQEAVVLNSVVSEMDGVVVAIEGVSGGNGRNSFGPTLSSYQTGWGEPVVAVADMDNLHIECDYIAKNTINKAKEIYALIDGERVEIEYVSMSVDEYNEIKEMNGEVYTSFLFHEVPDGVEAGDFVCIVMINDVNENVVSVSNSCIRRDENGEYVYVLQDGKSVYTPVKIGLKDSMYTAVLSGLNAGDEVLGATKSEYGKSTVTTVKEDFKTVFEAEGNLLYPKVTSVVSTIEYGTVHFESAKVTMFQMVKKGDILATVRVEIDEAEFQKEKTQLERLEQRYADFIASGTEGKELELAQKEKELNEQRAIVEKMNKDSVTTQILAPTDGIVTSIAQYFQSGKISTGAEIAKIADASSCFVMAENKNHQLSLGTEVEISYTTSQRKEAVITGEVVSMSGMGISGELSGNYAFIKVDADDIPDLSAGIINSWGVCQLKADIREMKNVVVVPRNAVTEVNGSAFIHIVNSDGSITTQSIVGGGYNSEKYWVAAGLTEGMELCLK